MSRFNYLITCLLVLISSSSTAQLTLGELIDLTKGHDYHYEKGDSIVDYQLFDFASFQPNQRLAESHLKKAYFKVHYANNTLIRIERYEKRELFFRCYVKYHEAGILMRASTFWDNKEENELFNFGRFLITSTRIYYIGSDLHPYVGNGFDGCHHHTFTNLWQVSAIQLLDRDLCVERNFKFVDSYLRFVADLKSKRKRAKASIYLFKQRMLVTNETLLLDIVTIKYDELGMDKIKTKVSCLDEYTKYLWLHNGEHEYSCFELEDVYP